MPLDHFKSSSSIEKHNFLNKYETVVSCHENQTSKYLMIANKKPKILPIIDDDRRLHENLKILEPRDSDDSDDLEQKRKIKAEKEANSKPYRLTYVKLKRKVRER